MPQLVQAALQQQAQPALPASLLAFMERSGWIPALQHHAAVMVAKYGLPNETTPTRMVWHHGYVNAPWKRSELLNEQIPHNFPAPHTDSLQQFIDFRVPPHVASALTLYDGSVYLDRTRGELSARCDDEAANFLAINIAWLIANGQLDWQNARRVYAETVLEGKHQYLFDGFVFDPVRGYQGDPDKAWLFGDELRARVQAPQLPMQGQQPQIQAQPQAEQSPQPGQTHGGPLLIPAPRPGGLPSVLHGFVPNYGRRDR